MGPVYDVRAGSNLMRVITQPTFVGAMGSSRERPVKLISSEFGLTLISANDSPLTSHYAVLGHTVECKEAFAEVVDVVLFQNDLIVLWRWH